MTTTPFQAKRNGVEKLMRHIAEFDIDWQTDAERHAQLSATRLETKYRDGAKINPSDFSVLLVCPSGQDQTKSIRQLDLIYGKDQRENLHAFYQAGKTFAYTKSGPVLVHIVSLAQHVPTATEYPHALRLIRDINQNDDAQYSILICSVSFDQRIIRAELPVEVISNNTIKVTGEAQFFSNVADSPDQIQPDHLASALFNGWLDEYTYLVERQAISITSDQFDISTVPPHLHDTLRHARQDFRDRFGRDPQANDPVLFDPEQDTPTSLNHKQIMSVVPEAAMGEHMTEEKLVSLLSIFEMFPELNQFGHYYKYFEWLDTQ